MFMKVLRRGLREALKIRLHPELELGKMLSLILRSAPFILALVN